MPTPADDLGGPLPAGTPPHGSPKRAAAALIANGANSASNLVLVVLLARTTAARDFGAIALLLTVVPLTVAFFRGAVVEPLVALAVHSDVRTGRREATVVGSVAGLAVLMVGLLLLDGDMHGLVFALAMGAGVTIVVERDRWSALSGSRSGVAALADTSWLAAQLVGFAIAPTSAAVAAGSWAVGATVAAVLGWLLGPRSKSGVSSEGTQHLRPWWGVEYVVAVADLQVALLVLPLTTGLQATGALRAASSMLGFSTVLASAIVQFTMRRMSSLRDEAVVQRTMRRVSVVSAALVLAATAPLLLLPGGAGRALLGATWEGARAVFPVLLVQRVASTFALGPMIAVRVLDRSTGLVRDRILLGLATVIGASVGGWQFGALGAAWAITVVTVVTTFLWFRRASQPQQR